MIEESYLPTTRPKKRGDNNSPSPALLATFIIIEMFIITIYYYLFIVGNQNQKKVVTLSFTCRTISLLFIIQIKSSYSNTLQGENSFPCRLYHRKN